MKYRNKLIKSYQCTIYLSILYIERRSETLKVEKYKQKKNLLSNETTESLVGVIKINLIRDDHVIESQN